VISDLAFLGEPPRSGDVIAAASGHWGGDAPA